VKTQGLQIAQLEARIAKLKRMQFGQSSEKIVREIEQLELELDELHEEEGKRAAGRPSVVQALVEKPYRKPLPPHLPREEEVHEASCTCPNCGGQMRRFGEDVTEVLEYVPASFKVIRHIRPKLSCRTCETIVQAPMPSLPIERGKPGPGLLAHVLVSKYADHLPLYRQSDIYAREGVELERSTLADWVGRSAALLEPLVTALRKEVMSSAVLHGDDTPVPVLAPGTGKTRTGRLWTYVRDGRPHGSEQPPVAAFFYSPDRKGEHPQAHLKGFNGILHADGYAGFNAVFERTEVREAACWAHVRRKFFDEQAATSSPIAGETLNRIGMLYTIEDGIRGGPPDTYNTSHKAGWIGFRPGEANNLYIATGDGAWNPTMAPPPVNVHAGSMPASAASARLCSSVNLPCDTIELAPARQDPGPERTRVAEVQGDPRPQGFDLLLRHECSGARRARWVVSLHC
jgi:transposase